MLPFCWGKRVAAAAHGFSYIYITEQRVKVDAEVAVLFGIPLGRVADAF